MRDQKWESIVVYLRMTQHGVQIAVLTKLPWQHRPLLHLHGSGVVHLATTSLKIIHFKHTQAESSEHYHINC